MQLTLTFMFTLTTAVFITGCLGGPVAQSTPCSQYVSCLNATDAVQGSTTNLVRFDLDGGCWANADTAELCTTGCVRALERLTEREAALPGACTP